MNFDHDWWHGDGLKRQIDDARRRCLRARFPDEQDPLQPRDPRAAAYAAAIEARVILYLRDNSIYEIKDLVDAGRTAYLTFECLPADEAYRVGSFVVAVPFDEIARVEVFAVHESEKPEDSPLIKGFAAGSRPVRPDDRPA